MSYSTIDVRFQDNICFIRFDRPEFKNTINDVLIAEMSQALAACESRCSIVVLEGSEEVFCFGADFQGMNATLPEADEPDINPEPLYNLWLKMATGPFVTIAYVRGKANAGGLGFVAACDIVLADQSAVFSLSELLFGLFPACVMPFLVRRTGFQKAHYLTLSTKPVGVEEACRIGLVDAYETNASTLLRTHLLRLKRLSVKGISRYKNYMNNLHGALGDVMPLAVAANREVFSDTENLEKIVRYVNTGLFPWE